MSIKGLIIYTSNGDASRPLTGLRGITVAVEGNLSVKVEDFRGRGLADIRIVTPDNKVSFTDELGNAFIVVTGTNIVLTLSKGRVTRRVSVPNGASQILVKMGKINY